MTEATSIPRVDALALWVRPGSFWSRLPWIGAGVGVMGLALALATGGGDSRFYFAWLVAYLFWLSLVWGALFFVLALFVSRAGWGVVVRRLSEHVMASVPVFALLFVPIWIGRHELFHWAEAEAVAHDPLLQAKTPYLNARFFLLRAVAYFVVWSWLGVWFRAQSARQDRTGDQAITRRLQRVAAPGLVAYALTVTFAGVDWMMSLEPHWYSTIFGVYVFAGAVVGFFAWVVLLVAALQAGGLLEDVVTSEHLHDLGKLLFGFTVFWAYIAFSQYFLIWYGNLPEETFWFLQRLEGSWKTASLWLAIGHFVLPFYFLMSRWVKRTKPLLCLGAAWLLAMHLLDVYWVVMPVHARGRFAPEAVDLGAWLAVGGFFLAAFGAWLRRGALIPVRDPRLPESLALENV